MQMHLLCLVFVLFSLCSASPVPAPQPWTTYVVPHSSGQDDSPALNAALAQNPLLATNATILFQKGVTYNLSTPVRFPRFKNVIVSIEGNITYGFDIQATQASVRSSSYPGHWFAFSGGSNVTLKGSTDPHWGWVDSHGQKWWDSMQKISSHVNRPSAWGFRGIIGGEIANMKIWKPIAWSFSISSTNVHIHDNMIMAVSDKATKPYNTDGFNVQGTNLLFENNVVYNDDDCIAVSSPANDITIRDSYCWGSHGMSVGSVGKNGAVVNIKNILFENITMEDVSYGARFKSFSGGRGVAENITWKDIKFKNVVLPIYITQNYWDQDDGAKPKSSDTSSTRIVSFTYENFTGIIKDTGNGVKGSTGQEVAVFDMFDGAADQIYVKDINLQTKSGSPVTVMCDPDAVSNVEGFKCQDGLFEPENY